MSSSGVSISKESAHNAGISGSILGQEDPLEKGMATHSGILAWRIPWTEKTGGYSPWGHKSQTRFSDSITTTMTEDVIVAWHHQLNGPKS